ncbi:MAG: hypothetical protein SFT92_01205 [Rickettsiales bacterium]|nr:hypothetical protein [Rickettsiales bacterium]
MFSHMQANDWKLVVFFAVVIIGGIILSKFGRPSSEICDENRRRAEEARESEIH